MYYIVKMSDIVWVPPRRLGEDPRQVAEEVLRGRYVGRYLEDAGLVLDVLRVNNVSLGKAIISSPSIYFRAEFEVLTFMPKVHEIVEGEVKAVLEHGIVITMGPIDGFVHISQLGDDVFVHRAGVLQGRRTRITYRRGDVVRARITGVSKPSPAAAARGEPIVRVSLTCRQPGMGKIEEGGEESGAA